MKVGSEKLLGKQTMILIANDDIANEFAVRRLVCLDDSHL